MFSGGITPRAIAAGQSNLQAVPVNQLMNARLCALQHLNAEGLTQKDF